MTTGGPRGIMPPMPDVHLLDRISVDPAICGGRPCIRGHRIWVSLILGLLAEGATVAEIRDDYRGIEEADVRACIAYGGRLAAGRFVDVA
ncbi:MAG: hypothetical protein QOE72_1508 [Chloroflexota bacterium]|nr:hypothetical protein [Chloroflexota bacterium]